MAQTFVPTQPGLVERKRTPDVLIEFERFDGTDRGQKKLDEKLCNLLEASVRWGDAPSVLILSAWSKGVVSAPNKEVFLQRVRQGFKSSVGAQVPAIRNTNCSVQPVYF